MQHLRHRRGDIEEDFFRTRRGQPNRSPLSDRAVYDASGQTAHKGITRADRDENPTHDDAPRRSSCRNDRRSLRLA